MTLQIEQYENEERELKLTVQVEEARVQETMRKLARKFAKNMRIPGFRPGKAPFHVVERWIGAEALRGEAADALSQEVYREATAQAGAIPFVPGSLDEIELSPMTFKITVPLQPKVDLGDYRSVRVEPSGVDIDDEAVNEAMEAIREKHALVEPAERAAKEGDLVIAGLKGVQGGEVLIDRESAELLLDPERLYPDTPFVENVVGMSAGDVKSFDIDTSDPDAEDGEDDEPELITFSITVNEVKSRYLPPLTDDLAKEEGDYETLLEMRMAVREQLTEAAQRKADSEYVEQVFQQILEDAQVTWPPAALEYELDQMVEEMEERFKQQGWTLEEYLKLQGKAIESLREELRPNAVTRLERSQVTFAIVQAEQLTMEDGELDQQIDDRLGRMGDVDEALIGQIREFYHSGEGKMMMANDILMEKYTDRLKAIGRGEAPELPEPSDEEEEE